MPLPDSASADPLLDAISSEIIRAKDAEQELAGEIRNIKGNLAPYYAIHSIGLPVRIGSYQYEFKNDSDSFERDLIRRPLDGDGKSEILLKSDRLRATFGSEVLSGLRISPSQTHLAFTLSEFQGRTDSLIIWPINHPEGFIAGPERVHDFEWGTEENEIIFSQREGLRADSIMRFRIGQVEPMLLFKSNDPRSHLKLSLSKSGKFIFVVDDLGECSKTYVLDLTTSSVGIKPFDLPSSETDRSEECISGKVEVDHSAGKFFALFKGGLSKDRQVSWADNNPSVLESEVTSAEGESIAQMEINGDSAAILKYAGNQTPQIILRSKDKETPIKLDESYTKVRFIPERPAQGSTLRFAAEGPFMPPALFEWKAGWDAPKRLEGTKIPIEIRHPPSDYLLERTTVRTGGGIKIPLTIRGKAQKLKSAPLILSIYGAYGESALPRFDRYELFLLDRGFILVTAHIRGGGEFGEKWHADGRGALKGNSVQDLLQAAEWLIENGYTDRSRLIVRGRSAGGLVAASALLKRPDLFRGAALDRPFLNVRAHGSDMKDSLSAREVNEWGDPADPKIDEAIRNYSPMELAVPNNLPVILIRGGLKDEVIKPEEIARWSSRLKGGKNNLRNPLVRFSPGGSHSGEYMIYREIEENAFETAFLENLIGE